MADLRADCGQCFALCCVALTFLRSSDFPVDKPAGRPCVHLSDAHRCTVHDSLPVLGYAGCVSFDCFGAGQRVSQETFAGQDWRTNPEVAADMFAALPIMRQLHELLVYLGDAHARPAAAALGPTIEALVTDVEAIASGERDQLLAADVDSLRAAVAPVLREASQLVRALWKGPEHAGADLAGARLAGADLRGADLRGALLIAADLRGADLFCADLLGADLRDVDLSGADLREALYLTTTALNSARGDAATLLPSCLDRPAHWA